MADNRHRLAQIARIPVHLPAAGLLRTELDRMSKPLQHLYDGLACLRKKRVVVAGDKQRNTHEINPFGISTLWNLPSVRWHHNNGEAPIGILFPYWSMP